MRWSNLSLADEHRARLPGYRDEAVVRHFEAPGAIATRFYEVRAKSILNRVPEASRMPFRWTVNPYRGCTHACQYCSAPETPVLLSDGRHKPIAELELGEPVYGTVLAGGRRRYVVTEVLDKWFVSKPAYRVRLVDGTELVASAEHRLLSESGWKHVHEPAGSSPDRPQLTIGDSLAGTGAFVRRAGETVDYRRGYVLAIAGLGSDLDRGTNARAGGWRRCGAELQRTAATRERVAVAAGDRDYEEWPMRPSLEWCRGFLAGGFDASGSWDAGGLRIASPDAVAMAWIERCARRLGFEPAPSRAPIGVRIGGGIAGQLRFVHLTDPVVTQPGSIEGLPVDAGAELGVVEIEPLGRAFLLCDITTGTGDFVANGIISHNCFARPTHTYLDFDAGRDFEREIVVKVNAPELLRAELARPSWKREHVALGTNTDPYQWAEGRYKLMPGIWEALRDAANPCSVLTKSPLLLRDLPLMREIAQRTEFGAALSVPTLDERAWRTTEPHTPNPRARLEAVAELTRAGIKTGVLVAPLMPGVNDAPEQVARILELASEAGAAYVIGIALHLRGDVKGLFLEWLKLHRPDLVSRYQALYRRGAYMPVEERRRLARLVDGPDLEPDRRIRGRSRQTEPERRPQPAGQSDQRRLF
ncbi:MAG: radical SAM protein [Solirubrobacteraceae bacterium]